MKSYADAHCDTVVKAMEAGENMLEFSGQLNLEKLAAYGSAVQIFAIWLEPKYYSIAMRQTVKYLDYYLEQMERYKDWKIKNRAGSLPYYLWKAAKPWKEKSLLCGCIIVWV